MTTRVRANAVYKFDPIFLDQLYPPAGNPQQGDLLRVVKLSGCPPPNTMGHCHVNFASGERSGEFAGLVHCYSLQRQRN